MRVELLNATENPEETICRAARNDYMSRYGPDLELADILDGVDGDSIPEQMDTLIEDLMDHSHFGPFEHAHATFHIGGVSRSLMAQLTRHRHASFDVQSMRYVSFDDIAPEPGEGFVVIPELDNAELHGRNAEFSDEVSKNNDEFISDVRTEVYEDALRSSVESYKKLLELGVAPENARMVLPIGTKVNIVFTMNVRALMHVADMRAAADSQWEIREMTNKVLDEAEKWCPAPFHYYRKDMEGRKNRLAP